MKRQLYRTNRQSRPEGQLNIGHEERQPHRMLGREVPSWSKNDIREPLEDLGGAQVRRVGFGVEW